MIKPPDVNCVKKWESGETDGEVDGEIITAEKLPTSQFEEKFSTCDMVEFIIYNVHLFYM